MEWTKELYTNAIYIIRKSESLLLIYFFTKLCTISFHRIIQRWSKNDIE